MYHYKSIYYSSEHIKEIVDGYVDIAIRHANSGWTPYLLSFMFRHIYGKPDRVMAQMEDEIYRVYKGILRRSLKYPSTASNVDKVSIWICAPDWPVPKGEKSSLQDVTINNGLHYHGIGLEPPWSRLPEGLDAHFITHQDCYARKDFFEQKEYPLMRVHAKAITEDPRYATQYVLKWVLRRRVDPGSIFKLPKAQSEFKRLPIDPRKLTGGEPF